MCMGHASWWPVQAKGAAGQRKSPAGICTDGADLYGTGKVPLCEVVALRTGGGAVRAFGPVPADWGVRPAGAGHAAQCYGPCTAPDSGKKGGADFLKTC